MHQVLKSDVNKILWIHALKEASYEGFKANMSWYYLFFCDNLTKQTKKFNGKENVTDHSISSEGFLYHYLTTLSIRGKVFKTDSNLLKDEIVMALLK